MRPYALTIAGFDPSAGAGVLADVKTMEASGVYGLAACTALTVQNDVAFERVSWVPLADIQDQVQLLLVRFPVKFIKIGLFESLPLLLELIRWLKAYNPAVQLIWDPVLKATAGYEFHARPAAELLQAICCELALLTPNRPEALRLLPAASPEAAAEALAAWCPVLLKGGHADGDFATDVLLVPEARHVLASPRLPHGEKHGSGCVLSAAILARLALGADLPDACWQGKTYTAAFLASNDTRLGYHSLLTVS
ncbi:bifunctional hydroxymethylpyrimidine kinase/phosphomethylpyrimidine kinase [Hymenobacter cheonanensis]|uniref:bifunctional hydroxymethylpyrimidine kinase/phosphomethylpyrimidine kinase n=1 Tax=Hymenobacter sp. CA2-7 TaxID=3063993 RepID=UPI002713021F|nr:hydroxymethylpyrimidine/phosphomethylpyrimidine kinase [Hymenobacter sp. CA2-7]MDO7884939.1 hydroxymethylpyrimidine/phosphomethylpyrimidine kinase [Hymenobacter sp. CA2-7]